MAQQAQIQCINKSDRFDPHNRIRNVGGYAGGGWKLKQEEAIAYIESGAWEFYVGPYGSHVDVIVATSWAENKYLKTRADGEHPNNLLSLLECA